MAFQARTEPGSAAITPTPTNYAEMSIPDIVSEIRVAYQTKEFDRVQEELLRREDKFHSEIVSLREEVEVEKLRRIEAEENLKKREEECEKGVKAKEDYEKLLKKVKENGLDDENEKLRQKIIALESENFELKELEKKRLIDDKSMVQLRVKVCRLEEEKVADKSALDALRVKNGELEEAVKKNLSVIEELKTEKGEMECEMLKREALFESLHKKFSELCDKVGKMENDMQLLMNVDSSGCGNNQVEPGPGVTCVVKEEKDFDDYKLENDIAGNASRGNKDALGVSAGVRLEIGKNIEVINLDDDDDDDIGCTLQGFHGKKAIPQITSENAHLHSSDAGQHKRKLDLDTEISTSTSTSSDDSLDLDNFQLSSRAIASEKRSKSSATKAFKMEKI